MIKKVKVTRAVKTAAKAANTRKIALKPGIYRKKSFIVLDMEGQSPATPVSVDFASEYTAELKQAKARMAWQQAMQAKAAAAWHGYDVTSQYPAAAAKLHGMNQPDQTLAGLPSNQQLDATITRLERIVELKGAIK
jgi:hypothetical protein